ncbi:hypothetical protein [Methanolapillus millepedarum]|uniref:Uncharacterized protein n=1 Tax=Methanolapillus millepedarum TaxID=3028296 RepID=A0AA96V326_9EURY|nr:hypothetical protein MsAc7_07100 [Methanosarcinaceae archaeon Ac7]
MNQQANRKKFSISISVSEHLVKKIDKLIKSGQFASVSDVVYVSVCEFLGIISFCENNPNFNHTDFLSSIEDDEISKNSISVTFNVFVLSEIKNISKITNNNQSIIVQKAIIYFINRYENLSMPIISLNNSDFPKTNAELRKIIREELNEWKKEFLNSDVVKK